MESANNQNDYEFSISSQGLETITPKSIKKEKGQHICINIEIGSGDDIRYYILEDTSDKDSERITRDFCVKNKIKDSQTH